MARYVITHKESNRQQVVDEVTINFLKSTQRIRKYYVEEYKEKPISKPVELESKAKKRVDEPKTEK